MVINMVPDWMVDLEDEDVTFIKRFIIASGSLKDMANEYEVTYPTVRLRLDRLIQKIQLTESNAGDPFVTLVKRLGIEDKLDLETAKLLISEYKKNTEEN